MKFEHLSPFVPPKDVLSLQLDLEVRTDDMCSIHSIYKYFGTHTVCQALMIARWTGQMWALTPWIFCFLSAGQ